MMQGARTAVLQPLLEKTLPWSTTLMTRSKTAFWRSDNEEEEVEEPHSSSKWYVKAIDVRS